MNVETMQMDSRIAAIYYRDYRHKVRAHREERKKKLGEEAKAAGKELGRIRIAKTRMEREDEELMRAYRALAQGQRILNLPTIMRRAGVNTQNQPNLAIARANWKDCYFHANNNGHAVFSSEDWLGWRRAKNHAVIKFPTNMYPQATRNLTHRLKALVPAIPAHLRPSGDLGEYHILWEPKWEPVAPADPLLLKQVSETIYIVLAQWDLTPIEQAVLEGRFVDA